MAQLRHYYTLRWTSRSGVNCGGRRGLARPPVSIPAHCEELATLIPDPFYPPHVPRFYTNGLSDTSQTRTHKPHTSHTHTRARPPPPQLPSSRQKHGIVSHVDASSCATGTMWGAHSVKQWVRGGEHR